MKQIASILTCLALGAAATLMAAPTQKPNIVYILVDDLGYSDTGFSGNRVIKTPNLDRLAKEGTILNCLYGQPLCSPTRAALMTGRYPVHTGVYAVVFPRAPWGLPLEERTLAEALREGGYETAMVGKWHLGESNEKYLPTRRGFDHQYGSWFGMVDYFTHKRGEFVDWHRDDKPAADEGYSTSLLGEEACRLIRSKNPDKPLFLYLSFNAVHEPFQAPAEFEAAYPDLQGVQKTYAAMVSAMDAAVGRVVAALQEAGLRENTLIVFSSDNGGYEPGRIADNTPLRSGKSTLYEGGVRLNALVNWPGRIPAGRQVDEPLHVVDWFPTFTKLAGLAAESARLLDGKDIWDVISAGARTPHDAILLSGTAGPLPGAIRMGDFKLLIGPSELQVAKRPVQRPEEMAVELYNLATDKEEKVDLAASNPGKVAELRARFAELIAQAVPPAGARAPTLAK
jgi:arylsulfatase A-like enzyme